MSAVELKREARQAAERRGHYMTNFTKVQSVNGNDVHHSFCRKCVGHAQVVPRPAPNGIDISGSAVAQNCKIESPSELRDTVEWVRILRSQPDQDSERMLKMMKVIPTTHDLCGKQWHDHNRSGKCLT